MSQKSKLPIVYSCSGASSAAQMANYIAVKLDRLKVAEMSCIAGLGGDVKPLVRMAKSGRPIIALDGCPLQCAGQILKRHGLKADKHYDLSRMGVKRNYHEEFDPDQAAQLLERIKGDLKPPVSVEGGSCAEPESAGPPLSGARPDFAADNPRELSSPVCYLEQFKDW